MENPFHKCPTCGAEAGEDCRTPKGRKKKSAHSNRPFSIKLEDPAKVAREIRETIKAGGLVVGLLGGRR